MRVKGIIALVLVVLIMVVIGMQTSKRFKGADYSDNNPISKRDLPVLVKEYLVNNPEVIVEAMQNLRAKAEQEKAKSAEGFIDKNLEQLKANRPYKGTGNTTIVEFFDYRCSFCKRSDATLNRIMDENKDVQVVFVNTPMLGDKSVLGAKASIAVWDISPQNFVSFHKDLMDANSIDLVFIEDLAKRYNIPRTKLLDRINSKEVEQKLADNLQIANSLGLQGVPAFILGKELISGSIGFEDWKQKIDKLGENKAIS